MNGKDIGIIGLGVMGENLALNFSNHGYSVAGYDLEPPKRERFAAATAGKNAAAYPDLHGFVAGLASPRKILLLVPAGKAVDQVIESVRPLVSAGDVLADGGNSLFKDTERRLKALEGSGILYVGTGVSGGEEGALRGPSIMPGGNPAAWPVLKPLLQSIAAKTADGSPCCEWVGNGGAGHFVKMIHNGIEYGDMQMICDAYSLLTRLLGFAPERGAEIFASWNRGELESYLIEITGRVLAKRDPETGRPMVDVILDAAGQKGTGKWTSQTALDLGVPAQTIAEAVFARCLSALKEERLRAAGLLAGPSRPFAGDAEAFVEKVRQALFASKICSYAQGFQLLRAADAEYGWKLNFGAIALLWRAGCIIRARFLDDIKKAFDAEPALANLLLAPYFQTAVGRCQESWRAVVSEAVLSGVPVPTFASALEYYDGYRSSTLPANLLQAQRDFFGAHTYERVDRPRGQFFHTDWSR
jgi:6-phosphogluconate dehydrogenase